MVRAISDNSNNDSSAGTRSTFTPRGATQMLPLVRRIVDDILMLQQSIDVQLQQLQTIDALPETMEHADYREEVSDIRSSLDQDQQRMDACVCELQSLGVQLHEPFDGSVDFPAEWNRREIRLCWHPDDESVKYFHEPGQDAKERKKIDPSWFTAESLN